MLKKFISYYKPHKKLFFLDMLASLFISLIAMCYPEITRRIFNEYVPNASIDQDYSIKMIIILGCILLGLYLIRSLLRFFVQYYGHVIGVRMQAQMRRELFTHLQKLPYSFFDEHETGKIMTRLNDDLMNVSELAHHGPENFFISGIMIIGSFAYLLWLNWILALVIFACVPFLIIITFSLKKKMDKAFLESRQSVSQINASIASSISGIRVTKAFTNSKKELEKFEVGNSSYVRSKSKAFKAMGTFGSSTSFVMDLFNVACICGGGIIAITRPDIFTVADYLAFVISISLFITPLRSLIDFVEQFEDGATGFKRFMEIMNVEEEKEKEGAITDIELQGNIVFEHVSFSYETKSNVLNDVSFTINKGDTIALVGESGGGKTTICHLIPSFYKLTSGDIKIDGYSINDLSLDTLRNSIGIVQQDVFLFNGTIKDNILYGKLDATEEEIIFASKKANIYDYIMSLPNGFDTQIGERGVKLSGGQKQRLSIARVFLKNPPILILDEATSALDNTTEILIQEALNELSKGRTTIVVAHRLSTIKNANRIMVVNDGRIIEEGTHEELMNSKGIYSSLYSLQFRK